MRRYGNTYQITIKKGEEVSEWFSIKGRASALLYIPEEWTSCDLGILAAYERPESATSWYALKDGKGTFGVESNIAAASGSTARSIPVMAYGANYIKLFCHNGTGEGVAQEADRTIVITTKD